MKPVVARLYGLLVILSFLSLIAWSVTDWYQQRQRAQDQGLATLRQVGGLLADRSLHPAPPGASTIAQAFTPLARADGRWKMVLLYGSGGVAEYYRGPRPPVSVEKAIPHWEPKGLSEVFVTVPVFRADGGPQNLEAIYEFYGRAEVLSLLKAVGFTLVILLVLTTIAVFLDSQVKKGPEPTSEPSWDEPTAPSFDSFETEGPESFDVPELDLTTGPNLENEEEYWFDDDLTMEDLPPLDGPIAPKESTGPSLFSPTTGLGWEDYLTTRLTFELDRSGSQNTDLALILLTPKEGSVEPELFGKAVKEAFPSADLDFEYGGGAAVILPSHSLEQALRAARAFVESADRNFSHVVIHAGVAARAGRLLSGETLLAEAESAKRRSLAGTARVLGLKTDPDRYREHLASASA